MRAFLHRDIIVRRDMRGVNIGPVPKGVPIERLRFDPRTRKVVNLDDLDEMYVEFKNGVFIIHCFPMKGTQKVVMKYADRKRLIMDPSGVIRLLTIQEWEDHQQAYFEEIDDSVLLREQVANFIEDLTFSRIDNHIENVFGTLNEAQKTSLKRLYKAVLYISKKAIR